MTNNHKPKLALVSRKQLYVFKCLYPGCNNFFSSNKTQSIKYCGNHSTYPTCRSKIRTVTYCNLGTIAFLFLICISPILYEQAYAAYFQDKGIGIIIENSCKISTTCINYTDILILDNSNELYAGKLIEKDGDISRVCNSNKNNFKFLQFEKDYQIIIDPCLQFKNQLKTITIVTQLDEYQTPGQMKIIESKSAPDRTAIYDLRVASKTRYVDPTCTHATITARDWGVVLVDTINFLKNNCDPEYTQLNTLTTEMILKTQHNISETYKYQLEQYYKYVKENCLNSFGKCNPPTIPHNKEPKKQTTLTKNDKKHHFIELIE